MANKSFFAAPQPAALLAHGVRRRCFIVFAGKTGAGAPGTKVVYVDGCAGPVRYDGGEPKSPDSSGRFTPRTARGSALTCVSAV